MGWNDSTETIVAGNGEVCVAPTGTALPAKTSDALNAAFFGLGYHTEDGVSINQSVNVTDFMAWQSKEPIRRTQQDRTFEITFSLLQWNEQSIPLAMGGGTISEPSAGNFKFVPPAATDALQEKALIVDVEDGTRKGRFVIPRGTVTDTAEIPFKKDEMSPLAVTFKALAPDDGTPAWFFLTNDAAAFAAGS